MRLSEYSDDEIIKEVKHRGIKIDVVDCYGERPSDNPRVVIGGVSFDLET